MGKKRYLYRDWWGKPEGKRPLGRPRHVWEDNIKVYITEFIVGRPGLNSSV
jgi:hypothetical protein